MPVRRGSVYTKNVKVRWRDKDTGRERTKAFHWRGPALDEAEWLRWVGHFEVRVEVLLQQDAYAKKLVRDYRYSEREAEEEARRRVLG